LLEDAAKQQPNELLFLLTLVRHYTDKQVALVSAMPQISVETECSGAVKFLAQKIEMVMMESRPTAFHKQGPYLCLYFEIASMLYKKQMDEHSMMPHL
jgi:hypothetical protein